MCSSSTYAFFFFNDTATTEIYTLSLHDALPIYPGRISEGPYSPAGRRRHHCGGAVPVSGRAADPEPPRALGWPRDRKSTRLNSSHANILYAVFCLEKKRMLLSGVHLAHVVFS